MPTKRDRARDDLLLERRLFLMGSCGGLGLGLPRLLVARYQEEVL